MMKSIIVCCLLFALSSTVFAQYSREEKLEQLKSRTDIKVTEIEKDILKIEYPHGKVIYKNIGDYKYPASSIPHSGGQRSEYSPTFDSTIIDLTTIDTMLYYQKYKFWQEVPLSNADFDYLRVGDINNNNKPELYGLRKLFNSDFEPITVYELNEANNFDQIYQYDTVIIARNIYDINGDGQLELHLTTSGWFGPPQQRFFSKTTHTSLATELNFTFSPYPEQFPTLFNQTLGDFDGDGYTDLLFSRSSTPYVYIFEYDPFTNNFDSVYRFEAEDGKGGFSVGDFNLDGKTDMAFGTINGNIYVIENEGDNQYINSWQGTVETYNVYFHTATNDIDKNGRPEFWVMGDAFYGKYAATRLTIFETDGDNSYHAVGRVDLIGIFSFYAGTIQAIDIDGDGVEEVAICIDDNFLILKFNGSQNHHSYELYYIKKNELATEVVGSNYYGAVIYDLLNDGNNEILISMNHILYQQNIFRNLTKIYKADSTTSSIDELILPVDIKLHQNYPNPFNPSTFIRFEIPERSNVSVKAYDILGKEIKLLLEDYIPAGEYNIQWNGKDDKENLLPGGVYFIQMQVGEYRQTIKSVLLK
jgi:hypothetical protein